MIRSSRLSFPCVLFLLLSTTVVRGESKPLSAWMPDDVIGILKLEGLGSRLEEFLASDLRKELESMDIVRFALSQKKWQEFEQKLGEFRTLTGKDPVAFFKDIAGRDILAGARLSFAGPEVILLVRTAGEKELQGSLQVLRDAGAKLAGHPIEGVKSSYLDRTIETIHNVSFASIGEVFAISNSRTAIENVLDLAGGKSASSIRSSALFGKAAPAALPHALATLAVRPQFIPNFRIPEKAEEALGSLLGGGWLAALDGSELITASLAVREGSLKLSVASVLGQHAKDEKRWEKNLGFFPDVVPDDLTARLEKRGVLGVVRLYRNLAHWWEHREELLTSKAAGDLIQFAQVMSIVFGGRNFQDEVLPELGQSITIVARNQEYPGLEDRPQPAIPAFAGIFELKNANEFGEDMEIAFQTMIGIINADQAQKKKEGGMAMRIKPEKVGDVDMFSVARKSPPKGEKPGMIHNFTPSMALVGSRVILSSSAELTRILIEELSRAGEKTAPAAPARDSLLIDGRAVHSIVVANKDLLVADSMLKKGKSKEEAANEINILLTLLEHVRDLRLDSEKTAADVRVSLELRTDLGAKAASTTPPAAKDAGSSGAGGKTGKSGKAVKL